MALLLMTGTIDSGYFNNTKTVVSNVEERKKQYYTTIEKYIKQSNFNKIVFAENSKYPFAKEYFTEISLKHGKMFEYIEVDTDIEKTIKKGKSYGEAHLISEAVKRSQLIATEDFFYKVTGRVYVKNINKLINNKPTCEFITRNNLEWCLTVFFKIRKDVFNRCLSGIEDSCIDVDAVENTCIEATYYKLLEKEKIKCFRVYPDLDGVLGSSGAPYNCSKKELFRKNILIKIGFFSYRNKFYLPILKLFWKIKFGKNYKKSDFFQ